MKNFLLTKAVILICKTRKCVTEYTHRHVMRVGVHHIHQLATPTQNKCNTIQNPEELMACQTTSIHHST